MPITRARHMFNARRTLSQELCVFPRTGSQGRMQSLHIYRAVLRTTAVELSTIQRNSPFTPDRPVPGAVGETSTTRHKTSRHVTLTCRTPCSVPARPNDNSLRQGGIHIESFPSDRRTESESARKGGNISSAEVSQLGKNFAQGVSNLGAPCSRFE